MERPVPNNIALVGPPADMEGMYKSPRSQWKMVGCRLRAREATSPHNLEVPTNLGRLQVGLGMLLRTHMDTKTSTMVSNGAGFPYVGVTFYIASWCSIHLGSNKIRQHKVGCAWLWLLAFCNFPSQVHSYWRWAFCVHPTSALVEATIIHPNLVASGRLEPKNK